MVVSSFLIRWMQTNPSEELDGLYRVIYGRRIDKYLIKSSQWKGSFFFFGLLGNKKNLCFLLWSGWSVSIRLCKHDAC